MKTSFKFKNLIYSIILVPFVFAVLPQQNSSLEKTTEGNSAFSTIDPAKSKNDSYIEQVAMGGGTSPKAGTHSAAVLVDQNGNESLYTWGSNDKGQLGLGYTSAPIATPQKVTGLPEGDIEQISLGDKYSAAIVNDGTSDYLYTWGYNEQGQLGLDNNTNYNTPKKVDCLPEGDIEQISTNVAHSAAVVNTEKGDELYTWGASAFGRLGRAGNNEIPGLVSFDGHVTGEYQIKDIAVGNVSSTAIITDNETGTDELYTWGNNDQKQLGIEDNTISNYSTPQNITSQFNAMKIKSFEDIAMGATSSAMVVVDEADNEQLYTWGSNKEGQLGIGFVSEEHIDSDNYFWQPQKVTNFSEDDKGDIEQISLYSKSIAVVMNSGNGDELWTWGDNDQGELGTGKEQQHIDSGVPTRIESFDTTNMTQVTSGFQSRMAITNNGTSLYVWGDNSKNQLGVEGVGNYYSPQEIDFYLMIPDIPFVQKWYFYFMLVILIFLIIGLIIGLLIYLKKRQLVR